MGTRGGVFHGTIMPRGSACRNTACRNSDLYPGVAWQCVTDFSGLIIHLRAHSLRTGDEHLAYTPHRLWHTLPYSSHVTFTYQCLMVRYCLNSSRHSHWKNKRTQLQTTTQKRPISTNKSFLTVSVTTTSTVAPLWHLWFNSKLN